MNLQTELILLCMFTNNLCNFNLVTRPVITFVQLRAFKLSLRVPASSIYLTLTPLRSSGIEDNPTIFYRLIRGSTDQTNKYDTFYLQQRHHNGWTHADIKVNSPLDYERIKVSLSTHRTYS